jgi:hypothetical protein
MPGNWHVPFGKGPSEKDPNHGHLVGGLLHHTWEGWVYLYVTWNTSVSEYSLRNEHSVDCDAGAFHRMTCVVDHDTGRLVWAAEGRNSETILKFFDALGEERTKELTHVSADGAEWIHTPVTARAPQAVLCLDPFHVVQWATNAVDKVRRGLWNTLRGKETPTRPTTLKEPAGPYSKTRKTSPANNAPRSRPSVAVGTALAGGPPHRSQRAELPHWAPASGTNVEARVGEGMHRAGGR